MRSFKRWLDKLERQALIFDNRFGAATSGHQCGAYRPNADRRSCFDKVNDS